MLTGTTVAHHGPAIEGRQPRTRISHSAVNPVAGPTGIRRFSGLPNVLFMDRQRDRPPSPQVRIVIGNVGWASTDRCCCSSVGGSETLLHPLMMMVV